MTRLKWHIRDLTKGHFVKSSLSVLLPVRNAEASLVDQIHRLLELLPDLTNRFEVVIIDDGSTDHTEEIARELMCEYPQVSLIRHKKSLGKSQVVREAAAAAKGEIVFVHEQGTIPSPADLRKMWALRTDASLVMPKALPRPKTISEDLLHRLGLWSHAIQPVTIAHTLGSLQAIDRGETAAAANGGGRNDNVRRDESHPEATKQRRGAGFLTHLRSLAGGD